jgi:hypothetical protein
MACCRKHEYSSDALEDATIRFYREHWLPDLRITHRPASA